MTTVTCERLGSGEVSCMGGADTGPTSARSDHIHMMDPRPVTSELIAEKPWSPPSTPREPFTFGEALVLGVGWVIIVIIVTRIVMRLTRRVRGAT